MKVESANSSVAASRTTLIAAHRAGRVGYGLELDPAYCDVIIKRLQKETGKPAKLHGSKETFESRASSTKQKELAHV